MNNKGVLLVVLLLIVAVSLIVLVPFGQIYAVNTLFKTEIEYSWLNWFCAIFLTGSVRSIAYTKSQNT